MGPRVPHPGVVLQESFNDKLEGWSDIIWFSLDYFLDFSKILCKGSGLSSAVLGVAEEKCDLPLGQHIKGLQ